jgi:hypothetical protein
MEQSHYEDIESKNIKAPADGLGVITAASRSGTPLETSTEDRMLNKSFDNLSLNKDKLSENKITTADNIYEHTSMSDDTSMQRNKNLSSQCYGQQDSSDNDDDEVNDLFKQIRKMSNRSGSQRSNNTSLKGSQEKTKSSNPFLEPFHRHSSVDMKGIKQISEYLI